MAKTTITLDDAIASIVSGVDYMLQEFDKVIEKGIAEGKSAEEIGDMLEEKSRELNRKMLPATTFKIQ